MAFQIPQHQYASGAMTNYQRVRKLAEENRVADEITFKWKTIDNSTAAEIREVIANIATNYNSPSKTHDPNVKEFLKALFKANMCASVTIDYKKLNSYGQEGSDYASILRTQLQSILDENASRLYISMTSNHTL